MDLTIKILLLMCVQAITGLFVSSFNEIIGLVLVWTAVGVNFSVLLFAIIKVYKSESKSKE